MNNQSLKIIVTLTPIFVLSAISLSCAQHYVEENGWSFHNFGTPEISWDIYRDGFTGIPPTQDAASSLFDVLFYEYVAKSAVTAGGNCYGMSTLSLFLVQQGGYRGICAPVSQHPGDFTGITGDYTGPTDTHVRDLINTLCLHQINLPAIEQYLDVFGMGKTRDGMYAFEQAQYYLDRGDLVVVNITFSMNPMDGGGHTMVAYELQDNGAADKRMYVYDSNRSWANTSQRTFYTSNSNYIQIDSSGNWSFNMPDGTVWSGSPSSGGNILVSPLSLTGPTSRSPISLGLNAVTFLNEFFIYGEGAALEQITSSEGKRLFKPGTMDIDSDPATGLRNIIPWYPSYAAKAIGKLSTYFLLGNPGNGTLDFKVRSGDKGYRFIAVGPRSGVQIQTLDGKGTDTIQLKSPGSISPILTVQNSVNASRYDIELTQEVQPRKQSRVFKLSNLSLPSGKSIELKIAKNQSILEIGSPQAQLTFDLQIRSRIGAKETVADLLNQAIDAGNHRTIHPIRWLDLQPNQINISTKPLP